MKCLNCGEEIEYVLAYSEAIQCAYLKDNKIEKWGELEDWGEDYHFDCPKCGEEVSAEIEV